MVSARPDPHTNTTSAKNSRTLFDDWGDMPKRIALTHLDFPRDDNEHAGDDLTGHEQS
jgi:hypothetical protein